MASNPVKVSPDLDHVVSKFNIATSKLMLQAFLAISSPSNANLSDLEPLITFYSDVLRKASNHAALSEAVSLLPDIGSALSYLALSEKLSLLEDTRTVCGLVDDVQVKFHFLTFFLEFVQTMLRTGVQQATDDEDREVVNWLKMLPKIMWDAGTGNPEVIKACLAIIHAAVRRQSFNVMQQMKVMQRELMLMFAIAREASNNRGIRARPGHLHHLTIDLQELAVDILYYVPSLSDLTVLTSLSICLMESYPVEVCRRLLDVISEKVAAGSVSSRALLHLVVGLLTGDSEWKIVGNKLEVMDAKRTGVLCSAACELVWSASFPIAVIQAIEREIISSFKLFSDHEVYPKELRKLYGLLSFLAFVCSNHNIPFGEEFGMLLPDILVHYWVAGMGNENSTFCRTLASWESPVQLLLIHSTGLSTKVIHALHADYLKASAGGSESLASQAVKLCESKTRVLKSLLFFSGEVVIQEKIILSKIFSTIANILENIKVGTHTKYRFKEEFGSCVAHCEHLWGTA